MKQADYDNYNNTVELPKTMEFGGEGKNKLYNKTIPAYLKKYGKKWNARVTDADIQNIPVTIFEITPEMKKDVVSSSQPLFEIFGTVSLSTWAASEVSDSMENNIISQTTENMY